MPVSRSASLPLSAPESSGQLGQGGWTPETLLTHLTTLLGAMDRRIELLASSDPTQNVAKLVEAAGRYSDELRKAESRRVDEVVKAESRRVDEVVKAESRRVDEQAAIRSDFSERLASAEAKRIDAIRAVDVNAVAVASQRAADQATVLAAQVVQSAEALRLLVASTATTVAQSQQQLATTLTTRLTALEQAGYQQQGKSARDDPAMLQLLQEVQALRAARDVSGGERRGVGTSWGILVGVVGFVLTLLTIGSVLFSVLGR